MRGEPITLTSVTVTRDEFGDETRTVTTRDYDDVLVAPVYANESDSTAPPVVIAHQLYLRGLSVQADSDDQVTLRGETWRVQGASATWATSPGGTVITVVRGAAS